MNVHFFRRLSPPTKTFAQVTSSPTKGTDPATVILRKHEPTQRTLRRKEHIPLVQFIGVRVL